MPETAVRPRRLDDVIARLERKQITRSLLQADGSAWSDDPAEQQEISGWLGWLPVVAEMRVKVDDLESFARQVRQDRVETVVLLGMGGSSLAPIVLSAVFGSAEGSPHLLVIDTTDPEAIRHADEQVDPDSSLFIVSSKSGGTIEPNVLADYFWQRSAEQGDRFVAITDADTSLATLAAERGFRRTFINRADIGGRYSALSYFGLVPAALIGVDLRDLLTSARDAVVSLENETARDNDAVELGAQLGAFANEGRDKVTFVASPELRTLGLWLEQLLAESTGKQGRGLVPVAGEELGEPSVYSDDRVFVALELDGLPLQDAARLHKLSDAGHPVITRRLGDPYNLGAEFVSWEIATAVAGAVLGVNPFDQPNVQESKDNTTRVLDELAQTGRLPALSTPISHGSLTLHGLEPAEAVEGLRAMFRAAAPGGYFAFMAYLAETATRQLKLDRLRLLVRDNTRLATTFGYGPRFLHSTGQLHKGGPPVGSFIQLRRTLARDLEIPGHDFTFGQLQEAQALGDLQALQSRGLPVLAVDLGEDVDKGLEEFTLLCRDALNS